MPTAQAAHYIALGDEAIGPFYHIESLSLESAATVASATTSLAGANAINVWNANNHSATAEILAKHPLAVWDSLTLKVSPGPGIFGRAVTLHLAWGQHNDPTPDTLAKLRQCWGYQRHTYGGASDPSVSERTIAAPFSASRSDILKTQSYHIGGRIQLFYIFTEASIGTVNADGPRFTFDLEGEYHVYGRN